MLQDVVFFNRAERRPQWASSRSPAPAFPVEVWKRAPFSPELVSRIERDAVRGSRATAFQIRLGGEDYQLVTRLLYEDEVGTALIGVFGFTVNLSWVREHYFPDLASQVAQIAGATDELTVHVLDDDGRGIVAIGGTVDRWLGETAPVAVGVFRSPHRLGHTVHAVALLASARSRLA